MEEMTQESKDEILFFISSERLESYGIDFEEQLKNYRHNIALCKSLYTSLCYFEICFRNAIDSTLTQYCNGEEWFDKLPLNIESKRKIMDAKTVIHSKNHPVTHGRIVSELSLGFWTALFSKKYAQCAFQGYMIARVFKNCPKSKRSIKNIQKNVDEIRELRNRICHYERISHFPNLQMRHDNILECIKFISTEIYSLALSSDTFSEVTK